MDPVPDIARHLGDRPVHLRLEILLTKGWHLIRRGTPQD